MGETTVVTFRAANAEDCVARFVTWAGGEATVRDRGTLDGVRRYEVDARQWSRYTRERSAKR